MIIFIIVTNCPELDDLPLIDINKKTTTDGTKLVVSYKNGNMFTDETKVKVITCLANASWDSRVEDLSCDCN